MVFSGIDFGVPQDRERCFMLSVLNGKEDVLANIRKKRFASRGYKCASIWHA